MVLPWSQRDERKLLVLIRDGASIADCQRAFPGRSQAAISVKRAVVKKDHWMWGAEHLGERRKLIGAWIKEYKPSSVLEAFAGKGDCTLLYAEVAKSVVAAEVNPRLLSIAQARLRSHPNVEFLGASAEELLFSLCARRREYRFDWIDLDPFGCVGHLVPMAVQLICSGYICITLTELHLFRFRRRDSLSCKYILPKNIFGLSSMTQMGYVLGWIIFDSSRHIFWRGRKLVGQPKLVRPLAIKAFGGLEGRIARVLFAIEPVARVGELRSHLFKDLKLFRNSQGLPFLDVRRYLV